MKHNRLWTYLCVISMITIKVKNDIGLKIGKNIKENDYKQFSNLQQKDKESHIILMFVSLVLLHAIIFVCIGKYIQDKD